MAEVRPTVVALGGNALIRSGEKGRYSEQSRNVRITAAALVELVKAGHNLVITHGNGPQVGSLLLQQEAAIGTVPPMPLDVLGARSQGQIGYMFQQALGDALRAAGMAGDVATIVTQVVVDADSPALKNPTKPIGPFYDRETAEMLQREKGWSIIEDSGRGYRRVVGSPQPRDIVEKAIIKRLVDAGVLVIATGGGGIPVVRNADGSLEGIEAVIDKDRGAALLASLVNARLLVILTDADQVSLNYGTPKQVNLGKVTVSQMRAYAAEGHFPPGSMGPKIEAALNFLTNGGERVVITRPELTLAGLEGKAGTQIQPDPVLSRS